jgi:hypothetical protein
MVANFEGQISSGSAHEDELYGEVTINGETFELGDLVRYSVSNVYDVPCEKRAAIVAPIQRIGRRTNETDGSFLYPVVSFAHLTVKIDDVEKATEKSIRSAWTDNAPDDTTGVLVRWHTGENSDNCPACAAGGVFAHSSDDVPEFFDEKY